MKKTITHPVFSIPISMVTLAAIVIIFMLAAEYI